MICASIEPEGGGGEGEREVVGWICWAFKTLAGPRPPPTFSDNQSPSIEAPISRAQEAGAKPEKIIELEQLTNAAMGKHQAQLSPAGVPHLVLVAVAVEPLYQGLGIGTALVGYGIEFADGEGVYSWVSASDTGAGWFGGKDFVEVGRLEVELDEYARRDDGSVTGNGEGEDGLWGAYCWRWMKRDVGGGKTTESKRM